MRIVGGTFRGRPLARPETNDIRPTSDRVREAVFNILTHNVAAAPLPGARIIDVFAGTGALGFEALSRGADYCLFVETDADARGLIRDNIDTFAAEGTTKIFRRDATKLGPCAPLHPFDVAFLDPPYAQGLAEAAIAALVTGKWLASNATLVVEERADVTLNWPASIAVWDQRTYSDSQVHFATYKPTADASEAVHD